MTSFKLLSSAHAPRLRSPQERRRRHPQQQRLHTRVAQRSLCSCTLQVITFPATVSVLRTKNKRFHSWPPFAQLLSALTAGLRLHNWPPPSQLLAIIVVFTEAAPQAQRAQHASQRGGRVGHIFLLRGTCCMDGEGVDGEGVEEWRVGRGADRQGSRPGCCTISFSCGRGSEDQFSQLKGGS